MADYKKMYYTLFNAVTDAVENLQQAQRQAEEMFVSDTENQIRLLLCDGKNPRRCFRRGFRIRFKQPRNGRG